MNTRLPMVDCRSLIEFCRDFDQHKNMTPSISRNKSNSSNPGSNSSSTSPLYHPFCERSPFAALDILLLILVISSLGFLIVPYLNTIYYEVIAISPMVFEVIRDVICEAPVAYVFGLLAAFSGVLVSIVVWEILAVKSRKCGKRDCKGLRKAVEFDIQLESEECVKYSPIGRVMDYGVNALELGKDHKELETELKKMAPLNGRTVLIFRTPCGCPVGRLEVWGAKRIRRIKK